MKMLVLIASVLLAPAARADTRSALDLGLLVTAEASLFADAMQTADIQRVPPRIEYNLILGTHPSDAKIAVYFAACGLATAGSWIALPEHLRFLVPLAVLAVEIPTIERNARFGYAIRF